MCRGRSTRLRSGCWTRSSPWASCPAEPSASCSGSGCTQVRPADALTVLHPAGWLGGLVRLMPSRPHLWHADEHGCSSAVERPPGCLVALLQPYLLPQGCWAGKLDRMALRQSRTHVLAAQHPAGKRPRAGLSALLAVGLVCLTCPLSSDCWAGKPKGRPGSRQHLSTGCLLCRRVATGSAVCTEDCGPHLHGLAVLAVARALGQQAQEAESRAKPQFGSACQRRPRSGSPVCTEEALTRCSDAYTARPAQQRETVYWRRRVCKA